MLVKGAQVMQLNMADGILKIMALGELTQCGPKSFPETMMT